MKRLIGKFSIQEVQETAAVREIQAVWTVYKSSEKYGLDFGKVCFEWQQKLAERGLRVKGRGVVPILEQLNIPVSTAYWWIKRYKESKGIIDVTLPTDPDSLQEDEDLDSPSLSITLTPKNLDDTRCLSMAKERLKFMKTKMELLLDIQNDPRWDQIKIQKVLGTYLSALRDFSKFVEKGILVLERRGIK